MVIFLDDSDVRESLSMGQAILAIEEALVQQGKMMVSIPPRMKIQLPKGRLMVMPAAVQGMGYTGLKAYTVFEKVCFLILLYSSRDGSLLAVMDADYLGQVRTGAVSAVATKAMTPNDSFTMGVLGSGSQARTLLEGLHSVRKIENVKVFSPNVEHRQSYAKEMSGKLGLEVVPVKSPEEAISESGIICAATPVREPVIKGDLLKKGAHVNAIGSTLPGMRELDDETISRSRLIVVDSKEQVLKESGDLMAPLAKGLISADQVFELSDLMLGRARERRDGDITIFKSVGTALQDIAVASAVYQLAAKKGRGTDLGDVLTSRRAAAP